MVNGNDTVMETQANDKGIAIFQTPTEQSISEQVQAGAIPAVSRGWKIFDYLLAAFYVIEGIIRLTSQSQVHGNKWIPFAVAMGLLTHSTGARVIGIIWFVINIVIVLVVL